LEGTNGDLIEVLFQYFHGGTEDHEKPWPEQPIYHRSFEASTSQIPILSIIAMTICSVRSKRGTSM
jgi:hypothetical protein